ncbi:PAS domain S-box protein [candidate division GN15 bacterium]|nr:PAS domain S-box protein [candidate division GN15 bacterium]
MGKSRSARNNELPRRKPAPPMDEPKVVTATTQAMIGRTDTSVSGDAVFQTIIGNLADAVFVHDLDGDFLLVNPTACQNLGYSEEELLQMGVEDVDAECIERDDRQRYWLSLKPGQKVMQRVRHRRRDGSEYTADVHINRINLDGQPAILAVARDLTELLQAQELHRKTEEMLLQSQRIAHTGSFIRDLATNEVTWSDEQYHLFGYEPAEIDLDYETVVEHIHPDDRQQFLSSNRALVEDNQEYDCEYRIVRKDGAIRWIRSRAIIERDDSDQPSRVVGAIQDITETVRVRTEREFDRELMRTMLDTSSEVMFLMDPEGTIVACNEALETRLGLHTHQIIGKSALELIDRDVADTRRQHVSRVLKSRKGVTFEDQRAGRFLRHTLQPVLDDDGEVKYIAVHGADLTDIRATETELEHKQLLLSQAELLSASGAFEWDLADGYFYASDGWKRIHGVSADRLTFEELTPLAHPEDRDRVKAAVEATISGKSDYNVEHRIVRADNQETRYIRANAIVQRDKDGKPVRILGSAQDITDQHFAHQHLAESEERYRTLIDTATDAIIVANPHTSIIIDANRQAEELLGLSHDEIVGLHQTEIHPPEEGECAKSKFGQATQNQGERYTQMHVQHKDGRRIPVEISSGGVVKAGGTDVHFGIFRDISSRLEAEMAERERQAELEQVFKAIPDAVLYADTQRRIVFVNPAFTEVFGYTANEAVGQSTALIYNSEKEHAQAGQQRYNPDCPADYSSYEIEYRKKNGETFLSETVGTPVFDSNDKLTGFLGIIRDITEKKAAENALKESQRFTQMIADTTPSLLYIYDVDENRNIWVNAATSVRFDWSESGTADDVTAMVHPED